MQETIQKLKKTMFEFDAEIAGKQAKLTSMKELFDEVEAMKEKRSSLSIAITRLEEFQSSDQTLVPLATTEDAWGHLAS